MPNEQKHTPGLLLSCPTCGNEYWSNDSPELCKVVEKGSKEIANLKADKMRLLEALEALLDHSEQYLNIGSVGGLELAIVNKARAAISATKEGV